MKSAKEFLELVEKLDGKSAKDPGYSLRDWFKDGGWVQAGGKYDGKPCARQPGQKTKPYCRDPDDRAAMSKKERNKRAAKKRKEDPNPNRSGEAKMVVQKEAAGEKDACYKKVKSRYKVWPSAYACVPEETSKALTRSGWKSVDELKIGEEILTHNLEKDELEFKPIQNIHRYKNAKTNIIQSGNTGFIFECTENHKWVISAPHQKSDRKSKYEKINQMFFIETKDLLENRSNKMIVVSAPYKGGSPIKKDLIYKYGDNWIEYILDITEEQRQTWLFSSIVYDGNQRKIERKTEKPDLVEEKEWNHTGPHNKQSFEFKQKDIEHRDAFLLSAFLNGGTVSWKAHKNKEIYCCSYVSNKRYKNASNIKLVGERTVDVWCPETENGTWVMSQEKDGKGIITITGNSGALVKCRKVGASNWGNKSEELDLFDLVYDFLISEDLDEQDVLDIMARVPIEEILEVIEEDADWKKRNFRPLPDDSIENVANKARKIMSDIRTQRARLLSRFRPRIQRQVKKKATQFLNINHALKMTQKNLNARMKEFDDNVNASNTIKRFQREEFILEYLLSYGYADSYDAAVEIYESMSDEWLYDILEEF